MDVLRELTTERGHLMVDGGMGTQLFSAGLGSGNPPEEWNITEPEKVQAIHQSYVEAGADIFLTNSFGGTGFRLKLHKLHERVYELNEAAAANGRVVADRWFEKTGNRVLVAGSMGPSGELLEPMGEMTPETCFKAFAEQAEGLAAGGADVLWIETMSSLEEVEAAVAGAMSASDLPVVVTMSFDTAGRTMMGVTGTAAVERLVPLGIAALGVNCGNNLVDSEAAIAEMRAADPDILLVSKANAGIPVWKGADLTYSGTPDVMAAHADRVRANGASIIGACCGSAAEHIVHMRAVLDGEAEVPVVDAPEPASARQDPEVARAGRRRRRG